MTQNLSFSQFRMLLKLSSKGKQKVSELANMLCLTSGAITGAADKLIVRGLIQRTRDEEDRRVVYIEITPEGEEIVQEIQEGQRETIAMFFDELPQEDTDHLIRIFSQALENIERHQKE
ncbi:MarR family winged helix-turn-helix transcriptional regulator [Paenibacillus radicibacter]|uniref:MarR family winged helix-turn-helix transcriptional regulator n=1 Tax=Paenibacillus radicibacter TaxID=2972488 RepID=UPI002158EB1C|nr:MarR family transcriptional regulator [Paenibacillus radicibacter]